MLLLRFTAEIAVAQQNGSGAAPPTLRDTHATGSIKLDGLLDDDAWREAEIAAELMQQSPKPCEPLLDYQAWE